MHNEQITLGERLKQLGHSVLALFGVGVNHVENLANNAQSVDMKLDDADTATEIDAQEALDAMSNALTEFGNIERQLEQKQQVVEHWESLAEKEGTKSLNYPEGSEENLTHRKLAKEALKNAEMARPELDLLKKAHEDARPLADQALHQAEMIGISKADALSQTRILRIQDATAEGKLILAKATRTGGLLSRTREMTSDVREALNRKEARADAEEQISDVLPKDAAMVEAEISLSGRKEQVDNNFEEMMKRLKTAASSEAPSA